nr:ribonuclease H-like domain, reverse transcriptase, RNA-dependent DNA polymerase [Tanacetum cinerariifolium]
MKAIRQVLRYVKGAKDHGITYKHNERNKIHGYNNSSYGVNTQEGKGNTGIIFYYETATQALWLKRLLSKLTHSEEDKVTIRVDNKSAIALIKNPVFHGRSKHIDTKYHFIRECVEREDIQVEFIEIPEFTGKVHPDDFIDWSIEEEDQVGARFLGVLKPEIADIVSFQPYWNYTDVCRLDLKVEKQNKAKSKGNTSRFTPPTRTAPPTAPKATTPTTLATDPIYDTDATPELDELGDELVYPDHREALVIQRVLNVDVSKSVDDNSWHRNNIFRTKCTSKGKVCDMII